MLLRYGDVMANDDLSRALIKRHGKLLGVARVQGYARQKHLVRKGIHDVPLRTRRRYGRNVQVHTFE